VLGVSDSGYYLWHNRPPSARAIRHAWLTEQIEAVHTVSNGVYGARLVRRVHAEHTLGHGIVVGHGAVEMLMRRAGLKGLPGSRRPRPKHQTPTAADLVAAPDATNCGSPTSPNTAPASARCTARSSWTSTPAAWSADRSTPPRPRRWSPTTSTWRSATAPPNADW
jgi:hypothetical protein